MTIEFIAWIRQQRRKTNVVFVFYVFCHDKCVIILFSIFWAHFVEVLQFIYFIRNVTAILLATQSNQIMGR